MELALDPILRPCHRRQLLVDLAEGKVNQLPYLLAVTVAGAAVYGLVLGSWRGEAMYFYVAAKLPLVLLATAAATLPINWLLAQLAGIRISLRAAAGLAFFALAIAALLLAGLAPVVWLFTLAAPAPGLEAVTAHNLLYVAHTTVIAAAGLRGTLELRRALVHVCGEPALANRMTAVWIAAFAFVGGEVGWSLRPFVGSVGLPVAFLRADALDGNVYEPLLTDILPHLFSFL